MPAFSWEQSTCEKPQNISPPVSCPCTDCNSVCGSEAEPKRETVISKQHNVKETFSVARRSAVIAVLRKSEKVALPLWDTCRFSASVAKITTLWSGTASLLYRQGKRRKIWSTEGTNYIAKGFLLSQSSSKTKTWQGMMKTLHIKITERRGEDKHAWALEESHAGGKQTSLSLADLCFQGNSGNRWTFWFSLTADVYRRYHIKSYCLRYSLPHKHDSPFSGFLELNLNTHCTSTTSVTPAAVMLYFLYFCNRAINEPDFKTEEPPVKEIISSALWTE